MSTAILFRKCLGFNDAKAFGTQIMKTDPRDPEAGSVELLACSNVTTTPDGCLQKVPQLVTALTHTAPVIRLSAGNRLLYGDGIDVWEWNGSTRTKRFAVLDGPLAHTPIDCRITNGTTVYISKDASPTAVASALGDTTNIPPTSTPYYKMPVYQEAFVHGSRLYAVNDEDPRCLQYSEDFHYNVWALGDRFLGMQQPILQAGSFPGVLVALQAGGVSVFVGSGPADFVAKFYPCAPINGSLFSGFISKVYGFGHVFLCNDGVYIVTAEGTLQNLTVDQTDYIDALNNSYSCATVKDGKYLAFGDVCTVEYDFKTKTVLKRDTFGIVGACVWNGVNYFATGSTLVTLDEEIDAGDSFDASLTLPFSDFGQRGVKSISDFYFTGTIAGDVTITATDQTGDSWSVDVTELGTVSNYRIKTPRGMLGNHISVRLDCTAGVFRLEELQAVFGASKRSKN